MGGFLRGDILSMATTGAELALDIGRGGDMRFLLLAQEAVRAAMRETDV
jgi:hypothetical protein